MIGFWVLVVSGWTSLSGQSTSSEAWVDSIISTMTLDQKIGQLFIIRAHSDLGQKHVDAVTAQIKKYHVGGLCFFQGAPGLQAEQTTGYQKISDIPLMVTMDAEWGLGMRFKEKGLSFPRQLLLGAVADDAEIERMGFAIGKQLRSIGVHVNFAPVADVNNNPLNPVIGDRSFGEDKDLVANKSIAYMKGLGKAGVLACGKHFPGHGDTDSDSHLTLPVIRHSMQRLEDVELYPFRKMIAAGMPSVMVAHLHVPAIDDENNISTTLSRTAVTGLLKEKLGFDGLIFTDALEMKGVTAHFDSDEIAIRAFEAGNDMLVLPDNLDAAYQGLKKAFQRGKLEESDLTERVKRILRVKYDLGLHNLTLPTAAEASAAAFDPIAIGLKHRLIEQAITVVQNKMAYIPLVDIVEPKYATLALGSVAKTTFQKRLNDYIDATHFNAPHTLTSDQETEFLKKLKAYDRVIISLHNLTNRPNARYGLTDAELRLIQNLQRQQGVILVVFGNPYSLQYFENIDHLIMAYEDQPETEDITAQGLVGVFGFKGHLPVSISNVFPIHHGYTTPSLGRLGQTVPERMGMSSDSLNAIKDIVEQMIRSKAAPGCQVLIAKNGRIVYHEAFGKHTYEEEDTVRLTDLYDLASVTKVAATTAAVIRLYKEGIIPVDENLGYFLPWLKGSNKERMVLRKVMAHHAGLQSWIPFYEKTISLEDDYWLQMEPYVYCNVPSLQYQIAVAGEMYLDTSYLDSIRQQIIASPLNADGTYVYSDLGFIMLAEIIKNRTGVTLDQYVDSVFYSPMGLHRIGFKPLLRFEPNEIVPTELDNYFRCQKLEGYVHDMASAMLGGVSGNAGLFSNAHDLAVVMQMMMNGGQYGGQHYLDPDIIDEFAKRAYRSTRRGIGFDMKELNPDKNVLTSLEASASTYGHTGFTGICAWNDPEHQLTYIFLSNRTFPTMRNVNKLANHKYRERIHTRAYKAIQGFKDYQIEPVQG